MKTLYTTKVTATGGRNGHVKSDNGVLDLDVKMPKALGGANDDFTNPEMLFAAGYSACFDSALNRVISLSKSPNRRNNGNCGSKHRTNRKRWFRAGCSA